MLLVLTKLNPHGLALTQVSSLPMVSQAAQMLALACQLQGAFERAAMQARKTSQTTIWQQIQDLAQKQGLLIKWQKDS